MKCKKVTAMLLAVSMALPMAACGVATEEIDAEKKTDAVEEESAGEEDAETADADSSERPTLTIFVDETWWPYEEWEGAVPEEFENRAGVNIEVSRAADGNQLPLMVASGEMPDMICSPNYKYLADSEVCYPLDELQTEYPDIEFDPDPVYQFVNRASDGHFYTIGVDYSPAYEYDEYDKVFTQGPGFAYRTDIAEELGITFNTLEDLDVAFEKVAEVYPDMITCSFAITHYFEWLMVQKGLSYATYYENEEGELEHYIYQDGMLDFYKKVNEWYRLGYITAENFAQTAEDDCKEVVVAGNTFAFFGYDILADNYNTAISLNGDDYYYQNVTIDLSENAKSYDTNAAGRGLYITRSCEDVEAAYRTLAYAYSDEGMRLLLWGIEGEDYSLNEEGYPVFTYNFNGGVEDFQERGLKYWGWMTLDGVIGSISDAAVESQTGDTRMSATSHVERNPVIGLIRYETDSDEAVIKSKLDEMVSNQNINIYMADSEEACEAAYYEMLNQAEEIGVDQLEAYANETYPRLKAEYDELIAAAE